MSGKNLGAKQVIDTMPESKASEIRLVFLEEAETHLNTIQSAIYQLAAESRLEQQELNAVILAAHSIKGGARMTGFHCLGELACRMEGFFKVFKDRIPKRNSELEYLLLLAQETLWKVFGLNREGEKVDGQWLQTQAHPLFEQLDLILKELTPAETDNSALKESQSVVALIFQTEIDQCLYLLESVLKQADKSCLFKEVLAIIQSLVELGEMLQLVGWSRLCESIIQELSAFPERVEALAPISLQKLRSMQQAVLSGQFDDLTEQLDNTREDAPSEQKKIENSSRVPVQLSILPSARFKVEDFSELNPESALALNHKYGIDHSHPKQFGIDSNNKEHLMELFNLVNDEHEHTSELILQLLRQHERSSQMLLALSQEIEQLADQCDATQAEESADSTKPNQTLFNGFNGNSNYRSIQGQASSQNGYCNGSAKSNGKVLDKNKNSHIQDFALGTLTPAHEPQISNSNNKIPAATEPTPPKHTILVVDDSLTIRSIVSAILSAAGYLPELAIDGKEAVDKLELGLGVSAVICDLDMPNLNGYGFLTHVKSDPRFSALPVVMLTSNNDEKSRKRAELLGAADYLTKPCKDEDLLLSLKQLV